MYAIIRTGGKQYRVAEGETLFVEREILNAVQDGKVSFNDVLMVGGDQPSVGAPLVSGASVKATVVREFRGHKIIVFKKKRRKMCKRKHGHRQDLVQLRIDSISV